MPREPIRELQAAARAAAAYVAPGSIVKRVVIIGENGERLLDTTVPVATAKPDEQPEEVQRGWRVTDRVAMFDGKVITVAPSRLNLLRVLVEAQTPLTAKELTVAAFDRHTTDENTRYHIRELKKELGAAFKFDGEVIQGDTDGYSLSLR